MAVIQWNQFYDKILIGKSLCPLTMKSEGTCVCGGKITFKTSGQQVMTTPPLSMREAGQVVYSNPLFKKEDIKTVQKKEQEKSDTPLTQYSKNAFVNSVRVNGTVNVSLRVHGNDENILTLNQVDYSLRGTTKYNTTKKYVVTQIRRN